MEKRESRFWFRLGLVAWAVAIVLRIAAAFLPDLVEGAYSRGLYPVIARALAGVHGLVQISIAEFVVGGLVLLALLLAVRTLVSFAARRAERRALLARTARSIVTVSGIAYLAFLIVWGLNYQRRPLAELAGYDTGTIAIDELVDLAGDLAERAAALRLDVDQDEFGVAMLEPGAPSFLHRASIGFERLAARHEFLRSTGGVPKGLFAPELLSMLGITGIFFPFTGEPNVNDDVPATLQPFIACHELGHQLGFAREDEANYLAWLACSAHPDADFRYSGTLGALAYVLGAVASVDPDAYLRIVGELDAGVLRDFEARRAYWARWASALSDLSTSINDVYLLSQGLEGGVDSYGRMVDLLVFERRQARSDSERAGDE